VPWDLAAYVAGFGLSFSLILAIGSQNAFVLKQGLKNQYVFLVCTICAISDAFLIGVGVAGFGAIVAQFPQIEVFARYFGALFLTGYGLLSLRSAFTTQHALTAEGESTQSVLKIVLLCLAFTWLNPHVYLDTIMLIGSISTQYQPHQWSFWLGAMNASLVFFFGLGFGARYLSPLFAKPQAWQILECVVGGVMLVIAYSLIT
jgi:L-lysine exporter family protein LysE/ArgO